MKTISIVTFLVVFSAQNLLAQPAERRITRSEYINQWKSEAVRHMHEYGIPASITLAQGILESGDGNSALARYANNHFGIKCHNWNGPGYYADDDAKNECFRKYHSAEESYRDHSDFLRTRKRYAFLFDLKSNDYKGWAKGLKQAGYATNPRYPQLLIKLIEDYDLAQYDKLKKVPSHTPVSTPPTISKLARHEIKVHDNDIKYVIVKKGDTFNKIAGEFDMRLWQIFKYNDLNKSDVVQPGDVIYLQPKRGKAKVKYHTVKEGDTMRDISQKYGVKLKSLYKKNNMRIGTEPNVGQQLSLKRRVKI